MRIEEQVIDDVRNAVDIVEIIGQHVKLKKRGKNYLGLCPFHQEKTPSFTVNSDKQMYHCFGCHKGGNVFTFVMEAEKISFVEAVRSLAQKAGIVVPDERPADGDRATESENLFNACRFAGQLFHTNLTKTEEGKAALEYFRTRGFTDDIIRTFGLGYSMNSWDVLAQKAVAEGLQADTLQKAGLVRLRDDGSMYDYFRGRAMFPIFSASLRVIGFGARKMREDDPIQGKYINSPETPIYSKSRVLYGLSHAKEAIRQEERALMVEGYADLISLFQSGVQNVVASSGTALTEEQLILLGRFTRRLVLVYDADSAGSNATLRGIDLALEKEFDVEIAELPEGEDPDSFVRTHGAEKFRELLQGAISFIEFKARQEMKAGSFASPEGKTRAVRSIVQSIAKIPDELKRNFFIKEVSEKFDLYESMLFRELERWVGGDRRGSARPASPPPPVPSEAIPLTAEPSDVAAPMSSAERDLLKLLLECPPPLIGFVNAHIGPGHFRNGQARELFRMILETAEVHGGIDVNLLLQEPANEPYRSLLTDLSVSKYEISPRWNDLDKTIGSSDIAEVARSIIRVLHRQQVMISMEENQRALKDARTQGLDALPLLRRQQELVELKKVIDMPDYLK